MLQHTRILIFVSIYLRTIATASVVPSNAVADVERTSIPSLYEKTAELLAMIIKLRREQKKKGLSSMDYFGDKSGENMRHLLEPFKLQLHRNNRLSSDYIGGSSAEFTMRKEKEDTVDFLKLLLQNLLQKPSHDNLDVRQYKINNPEVLEMYGSKKHLREKKSRESSVSREYADDEDQSRIRVTMINRLNSNEDRRRLGADISGGEGFASEERQTPRKKQRRPVPRTSEELNNPKKQFDITEFPKRKKKLDNYFDRNEDMNEAKRLPKRFKDSDDLQKPPKRSREPDEDEKIPKFTTRSAKNWDEVGKDQEATTKRKRIWDNTQEVVKQTTRWTRPDQTRPDQTRKDVEIETTKAWVKEWKKTTRNFQRQEYKPLKEVIKTNREYRASEYAGGYGIGRTPIPLRGKRIQYAD